MVLRPRAVVVSSIQLMSGKSSRRAKMLYALTALGRRSSAATKSGHPPCPAPASSAEAIPGDRWRCGNRHLNREERVAAKPLGRGSVRRTRTRITGTADHLRLMAWEPGSVYDQIARRGGYVRA